jgi:hypothetical protein
VASAPARRVQFDRGEAAFLVVRGGKVVATIAPARRGTGADLRRIRAERPPDDAWEGELRELRRFADTPTTDAPND